MFEIVLSWEAVKDWLSDSLGLSHHDLHLILGVLLTLMFGWILKDPLGSWRPLGIVFGLEVLNETSDFARYYQAGWPWTPQATLIDIAITIGPPLMIILAARWNSQAFYRFSRRDRLS